MEHWTGWLMVLNFAWMLTVVVLPVVTAMVGSMPTDRVQITVYVGTMLVNALVMTAMRVLVLRHPETWGEGRKPDSSSTAGALSVAVLLLVALLLALSVPGLGHPALLVLLLSDPSQAALERRSGR